MKHFYKLLLFTVLCIPAHAQWVKIGDRVESLSRPGLSLAWEGKAGEFRKGWSTYPGASLHYYIHRHNHQAVMAGPEYGLRYTHKSGLFSDIELSAQLYRSFYAGKTWEATGDGQFKRIPFAGQWGFAPGLSMAIGYDFRARNNKPFRLSGGAHYYQQWPYSHSFRHGYAVDITLHYLIKR